MADSEKVGIDWQPILEKANSDNRKLLVFTRNHCRFYNPSELNFNMFSFTDRIAFFEIETSEDAKICLFRKNKNTWGMRGKGKLKLKRILIHSYRNDFTNLFTQDNLDLSKAKFDEVFRGSYNADFKAEYESDLLALYNKYKDKNKNLHLTFPDTMFYSLVNVELFNPIFHDVKVFNDFIFGFDKDFWSGNEYIDNEYGGVYFDHANGLSNGAFLNNFPKTKQDVFLDFLNANNYYDKNMYNYNYGFLTRKYPNGFTLDDVRNELKDDYRFLTDEDVKIFFTSSNVFLYIFEDDIFGYIEYTPFYIPDKSDWTWGWCNATNMLVFNSEDYEDNENQAKNFEENPDSYIPPDNAQVTTVDEDGNPNTTTENPEETNPEDESKDKKDDKDSTNFPTTLDSTTSATLYEITHEQLNSFINYFWGNGITADSNILELLQGLYGNISEAVLGVNFIPVDLGIQTSPKGVKIGRLETSFQWQALTDNVVAKTIGSIDIKPQSKRKTFFDYAPYTEIKLYLPYLGIVDLDTNSYMDTTLTVKLIVDVASGNASFALLSDGCLYDTFTFQLGVSIPFTLSNGSQIQASYMQNAISCSLAVVTTPAKPVSGIKTIGTELNSLTDVTVPSYNNKGTVSGASTLGNCQNCILYIKRPIYNRPSNYGRMVGFPVNKTFKLSTLKGYTVCQNAKIASFDSKPTDTEYNEIIALLEKGVII